MCHKNNEVLWLRLLRRGGGGEEGVGEGGGGRGEGKRREGESTRQALLLHTVSSQPGSALYTRRNRSAGGLRVVIEDPARSQVSALSQHQLGKPHDRLLFSFTQLPILTNPHHHPPCRSPAFKDFSCPPCRSPASKDFSCPPCRSPAFKDFSCFKRLLRRDDRSEGDQWEVKPWI